MTHDPNMDFIHNKMFVRLVELNPASRARGLVQKGTVIIH